MLERSTAMRYYDRALMAEVNISAVCWLLAVNEIDGIPAALRSRMDVVRLEAPTSAHFDLLFDSILRKVADDLGVRSEMLPVLPRSAIAMISDAFAAHRSVRRLRRHVEDVVATFALVSPGTIQ